MGVCYNHRKNGRQGQGLVFVRVCPGLVFISFCFVYLLPTGGLYTIFLDLIGDHLYRFIQTLMAKRPLEMIRTLRPIFFRSSISGSAVQLRNSVTSLAIWEVVAGVPSSYSTRPSKRTRAIPMPVNYTHISN